MDEARDTKATSTAIKTPHFLAFYLVICQKINAHINIKILTRKTTIIRQNPLNIVSMIFAFINMMYPSKSYQVALLFGCICLNLR